VANLKDLTREYEARRFPPARRLDVHGEGPVAARQRALQWIQSFAHEAPGSELLVVVERGVRPGSRGGPVRKSVEAMLDQLQGGLIEWWQSFGPGSIALRIADDPRMSALSAPTAPDPKDDGRTPETAGAVLIPPDADIPEELLPVARRAAELRRMREGQSVSILDVLLRRIWIEAQAIAMDRRLTFDAALQQILRMEEQRAYEE
jgi:hypothetical protein